jgi:hypothetical protein
MVVTQGNGVQEFKEFKEFGRARLPNRRNTITGLMVWYFDSCGRA